MRVALMIGVSAMAAAAATVATAQDVDEGRFLYMAYCAACHGPEAQGDGQMAELMTIDPANLTQLAARNGGVFPTWPIVQQIDGRDPLLAHGGDMPLFGRWFEGDGPEVAVASETGQPILVSRPIADLVAYGPASLRSSLAIMICRTLRQGTLASTVFATSWPLCPCGEKISKAEQGLTPHACLLTSQSKPFATAHS